MIKQPKALRLANILEHKKPSQICLEVTAAELRRLHEVNKELVEALEVIRHGAKQARISGNDWRRELSLCENIADQVLAKARGTE